MWSRLSRLEKIIAWVGGLFLVALNVFLFEASFGHDGLLCEWGYDRDGAGETVSGCQ